MATQFPELQNVSKPNVSWGALGAWKDSQGLAAPAITRHMEAREKSTLTASIFCARAFQGRLGRGGEATQGCWLRARGYGALKQWEGQVDLLRSERVKVICCLLPAHERCGGCRRTAHTRPTRTGPPPGGPAEARDHTALERLSRRLRDLGRQGGH